MTDTVFVVSTDIKKSSKLWAFQGGMWMKNHILLHHAIIQVWADDFNYFILPNSPEGDAFVMYKFNSDTKNIQKEDIQKEVTNLQLRFERYRSLKRLIIQPDGSNNAVFADLVDQFGTRGNKPNVPGIHIRVGVASGIVSPDSWVSYNFYTSSFHSTPTQSVTSYRGPIVALSETMEQQSDVNGFSYASIDNPNNVTRIMASDLHKESLSEEPHSCNGFLHKTALKFLEFSAQQVEIERFATVAFVHHPSISDATHTKIMNHDRIESIKVKRDETMMMVFYPEKSATGPSIGDSCVQLALNTLYDMAGDKTEIGISFGLVNISSTPFIFNAIAPSKQPTSTITSSKDLFGDVVNLAARAAGAGIEDAKKTYWKEMTHKSLEGIYTVEQLQNALTTRGIDSVGKKEELAKRLLAKVQFKHNVASDPAEKKTFPLHFYGSEKRKVVLLNNNPATAELTKRKMQDFFDECWELNGALINAGTRKLYQCWKPKTKYFTSSSVSS